MVYFLMTREYWLHDSMGLVTQKYGIDLTLAEVVPLSVFWLDRKLVDPFFLDV